MNTLNTALTRQFSCTVGLLLLLVCTRLEAQNYPVDALQRHQQAHGSMEAVAALDLSVIIERAILTLDFIQTNPDNKLTHLNAFQNYLLPALNQSRANDSAYDATLVASLQFRYRQSLQSQVIYQLLPGGNSGGGNSGGGSSTSTYQNQTVTQASDCSKFSDGYRQYCNDSAFQTFIVAEVQGGSSTHYENLEMYLRTMDWERYQDQDELNQALVNAGIEPELISGFSRDFNPAVSVDLLDKFQQAQPLISENANYYLLKNIENVELLQQLRIPAAR